MYFNLRNCEIFLLTCQYVGTDKMFLLPLKNRSSTGTTFQGQSLLNELGLLLH